MTVRRWFGCVVCLLGLALLVGANLSVLGQDKDKKADDKKVDDKKTTDKKADDKKADDKKSDDKKADDKKADDKKADDKKTTDKKVEKDDKETKPSKEGTVKLVWRGFEKGTVFHQTLDTNTTQIMTVMGQEVTQKQDQKFYIKWTGEEKSKEGYWVVTQSIEGVEMDIEIGGNKISYKSTDDKQPANPMTDFFNALKTLKLKLTIDPATMEVKTIEGQKEFVQKLGGTNPQMEPLLKNILSEKALKQMAEPTWVAFPLDAVKEGSTWKKSSTLDLGPIGSYQTSFDYTLKKLDEKQAVIDVKSNLVYSKPSDSKNGLPFSIKEANLKSTKGEGTAIFDRELGYFKSSSLDMKLEGTLTIEVGGMETKVELKQDQSAKVASSKDPPAALKKASK